MSERENSNDDLEEKYSDDPQYTLDLNGNRYAMNEEFRRMIQERAHHEYEENEQFSCWWRVANADDEDDDDTIHQEGDPILVIETTGRMVPWERLDQLEVEMQDVSAFEESGQGNSDVDSGNGMKTMKPDDMPDDQDPDGGRESARTHFDITPQDFQEVPGPDGEDPDRIPAAPENFDEPSMVMWLPDNPERDHYWGAGRAMTSMTNWVEWNVQQRANQPRAEKDDSHDHWESLVNSKDCQKVGEYQPTQSPPSKPEGKSRAEKERGDEFENGRFGGNNWAV